MGLMGLKRKREAAVEALTSNGTEDSATTVAKRVLQEVCPICLEELRSFKTLGRPDACGHLFCKDEILQFCEARPRTQASWFAAASESPLF